MRANMGAQRAFNSKIDWQAKQAMQFVFKRDQYKKAWRRFKIH